ncbi:MAG: hypothetical protein BRD23_03605 [Halobacteriales archaeon SW_9_67_25]|nr:MAG: hypothetical protein BRD23_03605 [Halobacteriales archaeon SW_9_67_25]
MTDMAAGYNVREQTGNPEHASVDDVVELVLNRAQQPRRDHRDGHLDKLMTTVVDRYGTEAVRTVIQRVLVEGLPFRTATHDLDMHNVDGVRIGTTASQFLAERNRQHRN